MWKNYSNQKLKNVSYTNPNYKNKTSIIQEIKIQQQKKHLMTTHLLINRVLVVVWKTKLRIPIHYYFYTFRPVWREKNSTNGIVIECAIDQNYLLRKTCNFTSGWIISQFLEYSQVFSQFSDTSFSNIA